MPEALNQAAVDDLVIQAVKRVAQDFDESWDPARGRDTPILADGGLSSLTAVAVVMEIEQDLAESCGHSVSLASDSFMSASHSPLATVGTLSDFILAQLASA